jgi:hypothetical protein
LTIHSTGPSQQAVLLVELLDVDVADDLVNERGGRERPGQRERAADLDRLTDGAADAGPAAMRDRAQKRAMPATARRMESLMVISSS